MGRTAVSLLQGTVKGTQGSQTLTHLAVCLVKGSHNKTRTCSPSNSANFFCFYSLFSSVHFVTVLQFSIFLNKHTLSNGDRLSALWSSWFSVTFVAKNSYLLLLCSPPHTWYQPGKAILLFSNCSSSVALTGPIFTERANNILLFLLLLCIFPVVQTISLKA